jgi:hypothetical protein
MQNQSVQQTGIWEAVSALIALLSLIISGFALYVARKSADDAKRSADASENSVTVAEQSLKVSERSADAAEKSVTTNVEMFKRQGVIDLFESWEELRDIDPSKPITPDVVRAVRALELTASLWNHDIVKKEIIHQSFWDEFKHMHDRLTQFGQVPGLGKTGPELLTRRVRKAYKEMDDFDTGKEAGSSLSI